MSNRILDARQTLVDALAPILPGRVHAYKPAGRPSPPAIWVDQVSVTTVDNVIVATFSVVGVVDGADHSQLATLDDMIARSWDAVKATAGPKARLAQSRDIPVDGTSSTTVMDSRALHMLRGFVFTVDVPIQGRTICPPDVEAVTVPPVEYAEVT